MAALFWVIEYKRLLTRLSQLCHRSCHAQVKDDFMPNLTMTSQPKVQAGCAMGKGPVSKVLAYTRLPPVQKVTSVQHVVLGATQAYPDGL